MPMYFLSFFLELSGSNINFILILLLIISSLAVIYLGMSPFKKEVRHKIDRLESETDELNNLTKELEKKLSSIEEKINPHEGRMKKNEDEIESLRLKIEALEKLIQDWIKKEASKNENDTIEFYTKKSPDN